MTRRKLYERWSRSGGAIGRSIVVKSRAREDKWIFHVRGEAYFEYADSHEDAVAKLCARLSRQGEL